MAKPVNCAGCGLYCGAIEGIAVAFMCPACLAMKAKIRQLFDQTYSHEQYVEDTAKNAIYAKRGTNAFWDFYYKDFDNQIAAIEEIWRNGAEHE